MGLLVEALGLPNHPVVVFLFLTVAGFSYFLLLASASYLVFFVWQKRRFHPNHVHDPKETRRAIKWSFASVVGNALLMMPLHFGIAGGYSKLYFDPAEHGWGWIAGQALLILVITETLVYWVHRALHSDFLYDKVHKPHHSFVVTTPWVGVAFNPLDSFMQALPHHLCIFLFPVNAWVYLIFVSFLTMWAVMIHDRLSFMPWPGINYTGHHTLHHWYYNCNFGQFFTLWDRIGGTYRSPETEADDCPVDVNRPHVFRSKGSRPHEHAPAE
jgi:Delta7-sterol 5-desaturase